MRPYFCLFLLAVCCVAGCGRIKQKARSVSAGLEGSFREKATSLQKQAQKLTDTTLFPKGKPQIDDFYCEATCIDCAYLPIKKPLVLMNMNGLARWTFFSRQSFQSDSSLHADSIENNIVRLWGDTTLIYGQNWIDDQRDYFYNLSDKDSLTESYYNQTPNGYFILDLKTGNSYQFSDSLIWKKRLLENGVKNPKPRDIRKVWLQFVETLCLPWLPCKDLEKIKASPARDFFQHSL